MRSGSTDRWRCDVPSPNANRWTSLEVVVVSLVGAYLVTQLVRLALHVLHR